MNPGFRDLLRALSDAAVRFLVVGAYAVSFHSEPRATADLDIWVDATADNAARVLWGLAHDSPKCARALSHPGFHRR